MKEDKILNRAKTLLESGKYDKLVKGKHIAVIGAGGGGSNMLTQMVRNGLNSLEGVETILINSDAEHLLKAENVKKKVLIGNNMGGSGGANGSRTLASKMVKNAKESLEVLIKPYPLVVIMAGLGGGTGTELMIEMSRLAIEAKKVVIAIPALPFKAESGRRNAAMRALHEIEQTGATIIPVDNQSLIDRMPNMNLSDAFEVQSRIIQKKIAELHESSKRAILSEIIEDIKVQVAAEEAVAQAEISMSMNSSENPAVEIVMPPMSVGPEVITADTPGENFMSAPDEKDIPPSGAS